MTNNMLYKLLKYLALGAAAYLVFRFVPNQSIENTDILIVSAIIVLIYILFENLCSVYMSDDKPQLSKIEQMDLCSSVCAVKNENMADVEKPKPETKPEPKKEDTGTVNNIIQTILSEPVSDREPLGQQIPAKKAYEERAKMDANIGIERISSRAKEGVLSDESDYYDYNHLPMGDNINTGDFEYGYSFLPPEKWYPQPPFPPVCVAERKCPVCPIYTTGTPMDVKEWNDSRRVTQPDIINTKYIKEKLNSGR